MQEANVESQTSPGSKQKMLVSVLETLLECGPGLERLPPDHRDAGGEAGGEEREEELLMLDTLLQRLQATLLALYRLQASRLTKKGKDSAEGGAAPGLLVKNLYAESLKIKDKSAGSILRLLQEISKQMSHIRV
jgi:hypothetical protein